MRVSRLSPEHIGQNTVWGPAMFEKEPFWKNSYIYFHASSGETYMRECVWSSILNFIIAAWFSMRYVRE